MSDWHTYLRTYFDEPLLTADVVSRLLDEYRLRETEVVSWYNLAPVAHDVFNARVPAIIRIPTYCGHIRRSADLLEQLDVPYHAKVECFNSDTRFLLRDFVLYRSAILPISIVEDLGLTIYMYNRESPIEELSATINHSFNRFTRSEALEELAGASGVLSEQFARSISHHHLIPFYNIALVGRKLYVMYDALTAQTMGYCSEHIDQSDTVTTRPLTLVEFQNMAAVGAAWFAEIGANSSNMLLATHHIAHDVYTVDVGVVDLLYVGLQANWLPYSIDDETIRRLLYYARHTERGYLRLKTTTQDIDDILNGTIPIGPPHIRETVTPLTTKEEVISIWIRPEDRQNFVLLQRVWPQAWLNTYIEYSILHREPKTGPS